MPVQTKVGVELAVSAVDMTAAETAQSCNTLGPRGLQCPGSSSQHPRCVRPANRGGWPLPGCPPPDPHHDPNPYPTGAMADAQRSDPPAA